ncbi:hypothetical protein CD30_19075 [Ureibacillus massiliensis 4400831 = CIP 108448 = CCUG 49529]|uniref:Uncharacterized protein n=1 Tax=Ureibacillus massiliensis 4400831 = CIP 108448 = CCUG 49529 TaxID=1211035 RepID=A0A0A3JG90_9BACL|nr:hypothetical protein [Ureibacillus massiliensis]KGR86052.1 hypothetical protein CD30_19075 [Ureibacillus massiliensis 4400831 = CIP 108448 = CCUG 49529]
MPRKSIQNNEESNNEEIVQITPDDQNKEEVKNLTRMLAFVLDYLSDENNEEIDIGYLFDKTEGLREWWNQYQERNRKKIEEEIRESLSELSLEELNRIRQQLKEKQN